MGGSFQGTLPVAAEQATGRGVRGVVAAAAPHAAALGAEVLRAGGNAFDAVVTAGLAETVLLPPKCGLAGDLIALRLEPGQDAPTALLAIGGAPAGLVDAVARQGWGATGPSAVGVPGAPAGYAALAELGTRSLVELAAPAARLARDGFVWAPICTVLAEESHDLVARWNPEGTRYFPRGAAIAPGSVVRLPGLAAVLDEFAARGAGLFEGPVGDAAVAKVRQLGGVVTMEDLSRFGAADWCEPARGEVAGHEVWATPAPTHGPSLLAAVAAAQPGDDPGVVWQRVQTAIAERRGTLADPREGTSMVSAADADGNAVVVIHSNSYPRFGSGLVVADYDLILANRAGRGFTGEPGHPNFPAPGRRPATTLHAWAWGGDGRATLLGATPGGANQMPWNAQLIQQLVDDERPLGMLVVAPRWEWLQPDSDGEDGPAQGHGIRVEAGFAAADVDRLRAVADHLEEVARWGLRSAQQVLARPEPGAALTAAVDPRTGGTVVPA
ncbi:MAG: gamma-glutamyltransferase family protein [Actinobacteria bacterium]|nr:gamma-glutamyltransferase family protein [Actinomycetota bacterium]